MSTSSHGLLLTSLGLWRTFVSLKCYENIFERVYQRTFMLVGLFGRSILNGVGTGSGGGSSKQGGEQKELS